MAFGAQHIHPIDFNKSAAVGVDIPLSGPFGVKNTAVSGSLILDPPLSTQQTPFNSNYTTKAAIKNNLINYFLTNPGERPLNPTFGGGLRSFIFQQITTNNLDFLKERIGSDLNRFFKNVQINNLNVLERADLNIITVQLTYSVINTNISDALEIDFA